MAHGVPASSRPRSYHHKYFKHSVYYETIRSSRFIYTDNKIHPSQTTSLLSEGEMEIRCAYGGRVVGGGVRKVGHT